MAYAQNPGRDKAENKNISALTNGGTDPKKKKKPKGTSTTSTTNEKGSDPGGTRRKGTIYTDTTTTVYDGTTGTKKPAKPTGPTEPFKNPAAPNQTYKEFLDAKPGSPGKPAKTPDTPGRTEVNSSTRFVPDAIAGPKPLKSEGPSTKFDMPKGKTLDFSKNGSKPFSDLVAMKVSKGPGGHEPGDINNPRRKMSSYTKSGGMAERTMDDAVLTRSEATRLKTEIRMNNDDLREKYSPQNIAKNTSDMNARGKKEALRRGKNLIANNLQTVDSSRDVYDAEAKTMTGGSSRVRAKNKPAKDKAERGKRAKLRETKKTNATAKTAATKDKQNKIRATKIAAVEKKKKERAAQIKNRKRN
jgi:hypothetical protein